MKKHHDLRLTNILTSLEKGLAKLVAVGILGVAGPNMLKNEEGSYRNYYGFLMFYGIIVLLFLLFKVINYYRNKKRF